MIWCINSVEKNNINNEKLKNIVDEECYIFIFVFNIKLNHEIGDDFMNKEEFNKLLRETDIYSREEYNKIVLLLKHNLCQNIRIARKLSKKSPEEASALLGLEPQSLRRIEALNDRDDISLRVLMLAVMVYDMNVDFYFKDWKENEKLLTTNIEKH